MRKACQIAAAVLTDLIEVVKGCGNFANLFLSKRTILPFSKKRFIG